MNTKKTKQEITKTTDGINKIIMDYKLENLKAIDYKKS